jgi:hypothetical protein
MIMQNEAHSLYWNWMNYATYNQTFDKHSINFMAGTEASKSSWESLQLQKDQLSSNDIHVIGSDGKFVASSGSKDAQSKVSVFGRANYNFDNRYLLTATLGSHAFE